MKIKHSIECWIFDKSIKKFLLLQCPATENHKPYWQPVTGGRESDESPLNACIREVFEETSIHFNKKDIIEIIDHCVVIIFEKNMELHKTVFIAQTSDSQINISNEHINYKWVSPEKVSGYLLWESNKKTFKKIDIFIRQKIF